LKTIAHREVANLKDYIELAKERELLSRNGDYLILKRVPGSRMVQKMWIGLVPADPNNMGVGFLFFTSEEAAQNYADICHQWEPDLQYNGSFIVKKVKSLPGRKFLND